MTIAVPNYALALICIETMILWFLDIRTGWANKRRSRRLVLVVCTSVLLTMQVGLAYDLQSYYQGEIGNKGPSMGFPVYNENSDIQPGQSLRIGTISNFYTVIDLWAQIESWPNNVTLFIVDENIPQVRYELGNYSQGMLYFRLPYRYSRPFMIANWTVNLYNPSQNESIYVFISMFSDPMEDAGIIEKHWIDFSHEWPLIAILTLWFYTGASILHERSRKPTDRVQVSEEFQEGGSSHAQENPEQV